MYKLFFMHKSCERISKMIIFLLTNSDRCDRMIIGLSIIQISKE